MPPARAMRVNASKLLDRTAVLALGLAAGFAVGLSFNDGGRGRVAGWFAPAGSAPAPLPAVSAVPADTARPERSAAIPAAVTARVRASGQVRVGVFGDSFGNGVWSALYRQLPAAQGFEVLQFSKEATGFTRYNRLDLTKRAAEQVGAQPIDIAVICFGANDLNPLWKGVDIYPLLGPEWKAIVGPRVDAYIAAVRATGAQAFWLGLPVVRDATMDQQLQALDAFFAERMAKAGVPFLDTRPASVNAQGRYAERLPNRQTGRLQLIRERDGLHMNGIGYDRITADVVARVRVYSARVRRAAGLPPVATRPDGR